MKVPAAEIDRRMERFKEGVRGRGVKLTHQRLEVFRELAGSAEHPDADAIYRAVRKRIPTISLDTVYRTLWLLLDLGLVTTMGASRERTRFDANTESHHHFVCSLCGMTRDFYSETLGSVEVPAVVRSLGRVETTHVEARGVCMECMKKRRGKMKSKTKKGV